MEFRKILIFGASRGLGRSIVEHLPLHVSAFQSLTLVSRKSELLEKVREKSLSQWQNISPVIESHCFDMSTLDGQEDAEALMTFLKPDLVVYCAGGGPYGEFSSKEWKDHHWALQVGLIAPARLSHAWLKTRLSGDENGRFIVVGSRIAENQPDYGATSYAAAKHGLLGLISSLQPELKQSKSKVWLFSPGYIDTEMLPPQAVVRHNGTKIMSVGTAAQALLRWVKMDGPWHRVLN